MRPRRSQDVAALRRTVRSNSPATAPAFPARPRRCRGWRRGSDPLALHESPSGVGLCIVFARIVGQDRQGVNRGQRSSPPCRSKAMDRITGNEAGEHAEGDLCGSMAIEGEARPRESGQYRQQDPTGR